MDSTQNKTERITVSGIVQGVGFRPFVYNTALRHKLGGYILNNPDGVVIEIEGNPAEIDAFVFDLNNKAPQLARIIGIHRETVKASVGDKHYDVFEIRHSEQEGKPQTLISPDVCVCDDCLNEMFDPADRRYLYPFINCTNCGPRFTIIRELPYDRPYTTMSEFIMCPACEIEYANTTDRRFHAQPNACPLCGPGLQLLESKGSTIPGDPLINSIDLLKKGGIVALKGLGGFHIAVDATNEDAVNRLRRRKHREEKPLALMVDSPETARKIAVIDDITHHLFISRERPIVLAFKQKKLPESLNIAGSVAPFNQYFGVMLPYTPLHYLLFFHPVTGGNYNRNIPVFRALVMTSGNLSEEPICKDNNEALERLSGVADALLVHNRRIHVRCDDSVITSTDGKVSLVRRSRGYVPMPVFSPKPLSQVLAFGAELKNTLCVTDGYRAFVSQHIGDLENLPTLDFFNEAVIHFTNIMDIKPKLYAYDLHHEYLSTKYFMKIRKGLDKKRHGGVGVQHHHAHIASVMGEHGQSGPVLGFSMDGAGYGLDGAIWGGEVLLCTLDSFIRYAHLAYVPMPGGKAAIREPWRMAFAYLRHTFGEDWRSFRLPCTEQVTPEEFEMLDTACRTGVNCPPTSSLGRLFDAVASILDIRHIAAFEGQAAMMLEACAVASDIKDTLPYDIQSHAAEFYDNYPVLWGNVSKLPEQKLTKIPRSYIIDFAPIVKSMVMDFQQGKSKSECAAAFHNTLLASFVEIAVKARNDTGIGTVALSGGCWQNRILCERFPALLRKKGFTVLQNRQVPVNDGGISLGQAFVAAAIAGK
ncbi:MAG: carbamoyltransferase HypF [Candidatus Latescibacteria bacterium]|nr:carbamoyltransferase HypF [Candidatus Latescibacterota bacterium]